MGFIGYTIGLMAEAKFGKGSPKPVKAEFSRNEDGSVKIAAVSAHTLGQIDGAGVVNISAEEYENRPHDPYNGVPTAIWALQKLGFEVAA